MTMFTVGFFAGIVYTIAMIALWLVVKERRLNRVFKEVDDDGTN